MCAFLAQTFLGDREALNCTLCGLALALMSRNVDRAFWTLGRGGVGQSLFTTLIESAIRPMHSYIDCDILYHDEELRKQLPNLAPYICWTAQEAKEGGNKGGASIRQGLYKKLRSNDRMKARPPYSIITKLISLPGLLRFELSRVLNFSNVKDETFDIIYMRSMVIRLQATFIPTIEYEKLQKGKALELGIFSEG